MRSRLFLGATKKKGITMPRITEHFGITGSVPFLDVEVTTDNRLFIDPHAIRLRTEPEPFVTQANACTTSFFNSVAV